METSSSVNRSAKLPFGDPMGEKADLDQAQHEFVSLDEKQFASGITISALDRNVRIIVGKKGSGKTVYLRRLHDSARREESVFASKIAADAPTTHQVMAFCQRFPPSKLTEAWQQAWRVAILMSTVSQLANKSMFAQHLDQDAFRRHVCQILNRKQIADVERTAYAEIKDVLSRVSYSDFWKNVEDSRWDDLQTILDTYLKECPPVFLYLDASDDEFARAPMDWHQCQKGLFYAVKRLFGQTGAISSRLHAVVVLRDIVYSSVLTDEHKTRHVGSSSIALLDWNMNSISYFYDEKLKQVADEYFDDPDNRTSGSFLGIDTIHNVSRGIHEDAKVYLLRHTRGLPRDVVQLGNAIAAEKARGARLRADWPERLRRLVARTASMFGDEQIEVCANQLSSHEAPSGAAHHGYEELYTSNKDYILSRAELIRKFIRLIGQERFSYSDLIAAQEVMADEFPTGVSLGTILWQNGLVGVREKRISKRFVFYSLSSSPHFSIPEDGEEYAFHTIILDSVKGLKIVTNEPVIEEC